ncbi:MAG: hypothetical protein H5T69_09335 [Chloroflexi bacterium]|nr:hypothetical protein [Chloroflexota bacterium]
MITLFAATLFSAAFSLIVRHAQLRRGNLWAVGAINYLVAATFHLGRWWLAPASEVDLSTSLLGALGGVVYSGSYLLLLPLMQARGVSVSTAILRLSIIIPVGLSIALWGERPNVFQTLGAAVALVSLPLLAYRPGRAAEVAPEGIASRRGPGLLLLGALFVGNGLCATTVRAFRQTNVPTQGALFLGILFGTAAVISFVAWLLNRRGTTGRDLLPGVLLGMCNALSNLALLAALAQLPGVLVFPFQSALGLVIVALFARVTWHERILRSEAWGMALAIAAVVLINMGQTSS